MPPYYFRCGFTDTDFSDFKKLPPIDTQNIEDLFSLQPFGRSENNFNIKQHFYIILYL